MALARMACIPVAGSSHSQAHTTMSAQLPGEVNDAALPKILADLRKPEVCHHALATICVLMPRMTDPQLELVSGHVPTFLDLLAATDQPVIQVLYHARGTQRSRIMHAPPWRQRCPQQPVQCSQDGSWGRPCLRKRCLSPAASLGVAAQSNAVVALTALSSQHEPSRERLAELAVRRACAVVSCNAGMPALHARCVLQPPWAGHPSGSAGATATRRLAGRRRSCMRSRQPCW